MTKQEVLIQMMGAAHKLVQERGIPADAACRIAARATFKAAGLPIPAGLGADIVSSVPVAIADVPANAPAILANIASAGASPTVATARDIVNKWSWIIPVGGILMSLKQKVSSLRSPTAVAMVGGRRDR